MNYQLSNGKTLIINTEKLMGMSEAQIDKLIEDAELGYISTLEIENEWYESLKEETDYKAQIAKNKNTSKFIPSIDNLSSFPEEEADGNPLDESLDIPYTD